MTRFQILACAAFALSAVASAQPKPISRADYLKTVDGHFAGADTNHDGFMSKQELIAQQARDIENARAKVIRDLTTTFNKLDTNHDGKLSLQEYLAVAPAVRTTESVEQMMARLDTNHDGKISAAEFRDPELAKFNKVDTNHDGIVSVQELQAAGAR